MGRLHRKLKWNKITSHGYGGFQHGLNNTQDTEKPQKETNEEKSEQTKKQSFKNVHEKIKSKQLEY